MNQQRRKFGDHAAQVAEFTDTIIDRIKKLAELHEAGILTEEEFTAKKSELLSHL